MYQNYFMCVSEPSIHKNKALEFSIFRHFFQFFFQLTYKRVDLYASIYVFTFEFELELQRTKKNFNGKNDVQRLIVQNMSMHVPKSAL